MKDRLLELLRAALQEALRNGSLRTLNPPPVILERPRDPAHGDFSTNLAMLLAGAEKKSPRAVAEILLRHLGEKNSGIIERTQVAGPGFINFTVRRDVWMQEFRRKALAGTLCATANLGQGRKIQVEFVSANPTGPLHVGHGRGAAVGDVLANILKKVGWDVFREYYINDTGKQIETLGRSTYLRYLELLGRSVEFPPDCYQGDYIVEIAREIRNRHGDGLADKPESEVVPFFAKFTADWILEGIRKDLENFGVSFDCWFSEASLHARGEVEQALEEIRKKGLAYEQDGALWVKSSDLGDEKDRVAVRQGGETTYYAADIAYLRDKYRRGFERIIDIWGADHHGYVPRVNAAVQAFDHPPESFHVLLVQLVTLRRGREVISMSTRSGTFVELAEVVREVGTDAARFFFLTRRCDSPLDFDLELAKQKSADNPVFYVQYAHARVCSILRTAAERGLLRQGGETVSASRVEEMLAQQPQELFGVLPGGAEVDLAGLEEAEEVGLVKEILAYPDLVEGSGETLEPHRLTCYLQEVAGLFHGYYNRTRVVSEDPGKTACRLFLVTGILQILRDGLALLGVSAPRSM
ncbi:MAG: arginine--tRNA ligase [Candidatus Tectomicrobia bacterium]|uniref:Arginine--tRNA ligase n=1 Tax=Tectimicrobiota bacterium TaxID=2528274 RepID=A0A932GN50_UNCTE|nr:arginine--tRNA ligase [Candidatus Tectomicrobia bacterium]